MLAVAGHLILSVFAIAISYASKTNWQASSRNFWIWFGLFILSQGAGITLVMTSANSSLSVTITIIVGLCLAGAVLIKPVLKILHGKKRTKGRRDF